MPFKKGHKLGKGRPKGKENKLTKDARQLFIETIEGQVPNINEAFLDVLNGTEDENGEQITKPDPLRYLELMAKYAQYFVPKKTENDNTHSGDITYIQLGNGKKPK